MKLLYLYLQLFHNITDWKEIIHRTKNIVTEFWFENLNLYPFIRNEIYRFLRNNKPELIKKYKEIYLTNSNYWNIEEKEIKKYCKKNKIN